MNCVFCNNPVFGGDGVSVPGKGPAHSACLMANETLKRTFQGLDITELSDGDLADLKDLVLSEENARNPTSAADNIELF